MLLFFLERCAIRAFCNKKERRPAEEFLIAIWLQDKKPIDPEKHDDPGLR